MNLYICFPFETGQEKGVGVEQQQCFMNPHLLINIYLLIYHIFDILFSLIETNSVEDFGRPFLISCELRGVGYITPTANYFCQV